MSLSKQILDQNQSDHNQPFKTSFPTENNHVHPKLVMRCKTEENISGAKPLINVSHCVLKE